MIKVVEHILMVFAVYSHAGGDLWDQELRVRIQNPDLV